MCGLVGVVGTEKLQVADAIAHMNEAQFHRGPDGAGINIFELTKNRFLGLGHTRLAIQDLSSAGAQPMYDPENDNWIVFNGEVYNYQEIRQILSKDGVKFLGHSDTEVILRAYAKWGKASFTMLEGMFAIVIYDAKEKKLILARDILGIKPLYYFTDGKALYFASELRAFNQVESIPKNIDRRALIGLLAYGAVQEPLTIYENISMFEPGYMAQIDLSRDEIFLEKQNYFEIPEQSDFSSRDEVITKLRKALVSAARTHQISDVPVGLFLSGGLDSSALAALFTDTASQPLETYTISFKHDNFDEGEVAKKTAAALGAIHHDVKLTYEDAMIMVPEYLQAMDQPTIDGLNTYIVSKMVRQNGIKVAVSGLGGDELMGGYSTFTDIPLLLKLAPLFSWIPKSIRRKIVPAVFCFASEQTRIKAVEMLCGSFDLKSLYFKRRRLLSNHELELIGFQLHDDRLDDDLIPFESLPDKYLDNVDTEGAISILESRFYMRNTLLRDSDVFGMAVGLEIRVPLLDKSIVNLLYKIKGIFRRPFDGVNKPLLVDAMGVQLDKDLVKMAKRGFSLPQSEWMVGPLRTEFESYLEYLCNDCGFDRAGIYKIWNRFLDDPKGGSWSRAWMLCVLGAWLKKNTNSSRIFP